MERLKNLKNSGQTGIGYLIINHGTGTADGTLLKYYIYLNA